jgi:hypothetical protein
MAWNRKKRKRVKVSLYIFYLKFEANGIEGTGE